MPLIPNTPHQIPYTSIYHSSFHFWNIKIFPASGLEWPRNDEHRRFRALLSSLSIRFGGRCLLSCLMGMMRKEIKKKMRKNKMMLMIGDWWWMNRMMLIMMMLIMTKKKKKKKKNLLQRYAVFRNLNSQLCSIRPIFCDCHVWFYSHLLANMNS